MVTINDAFSKFVKERRAEKKIQATTLAKDARVSRQTVHHIEAGSHNPSLTTVNDVLRALGSDWNELLNFWTKP